MIYDALCVMINMMISTIVNKMRIIDGSQYMIYEYMIVATPWTIFMINMLINMMLDMMIRIGGSV